MTKPTAWRRRLLRFEDLLLTVLVGTLIMLAGGQILARMAFDWGFSWADGLLRTLVVWTAMFGAMAAARDEKHLAVDLVPHLRSPLLRRSSTVVARGFATIVCLLMAWYCWQLVLLEGEGNARVFLAVPTWCAQLILPFGFAVMALRFGAQGWRVLRGERSP